MVSLYTLTIRSEFAAAHQLRNYPGDCARLHGHNWKLEVQVTANKLDDKGMVVDFKAIKQATNEIAGMFDHHNLNEIAPFTHLNPTAENIAAYFYHALSEMLNDDRVKIKSVSVWETDRACASYTEE